MRRVCARCAAAGVLVLMSAAPSAADVLDYVGKTVRSVRLSIEGRDTVDPSLTQVIETPPGRQLSMMDVRETAAHFYSMGRFEDIVVHAEKDGDGIALVYDLVPVHPVARLVLTGSIKGPGIDEDRMRRALIERYGSSPIPERASDMAMLIQEQLRERGYLRPSVSTSVEVIHNPHQTTLTFTIAAGERARVGTVEVNGTPGVPQPELIERLGLGAGAPYDPDTLATRVERYLSERRQRGYVEARLAPDVRVTSDGRSANVVLNVDQGPRVRVEFRGDPLPEDRRNDLVPISREGSANEDLLEDASNAIEEYLRGQGYRDAAAPHAREESAGELRITFNVKRGPQYRVADIQMSGNAVIPSAELEPRLRLKRCQPFSSAFLEADLTFIEEVYHRSGFALARAEVTIEPAAPTAADAAEAPLIVRIPITEGVQTIVHSVRISGNESVDESRLLDGLGLVAGQPFFATQMAIDRDSLELKYANLGYPNATVASNPGLGPDGSEADVVFNVREGPRIFVDHVLIAGARRTRTETIERELQLKSGDPLGLAAVAESQRRLAALGLFRRTRITELGHGDETSRDLLVSVEESPATTVGYGGGLEVGQRVRTENGVANEELEVAPRAFFEIGRRNLWGKNRSVNLFTRVSLRPTDSGLTPSGTTTFGGYGFSEYRILGTFREPRVFDTTADAFLTGTIEQQIRSSFNFARRALSAEVAKRLTPRVSVGGNYLIQRIELFDEKIAPADKLLVDRLFPQYRLSSFSFSIVKDTRDDALNPAEGNYLSANAQLAAPLIGSEVGFIKTYLTTQIFRPVPRTRQIIFAGSARLGTAVGFVRDVMKVDENGNPILDENGDPIMETIRDLPASERYFAGGDTTVRGFALDSLGTSETIDKNGFPIGGNAVVIFNAELRVPLFASVGAVGFVDTGNVFARTSNIDFGELRPTVGVGLRYKSPVGPIRVDVGFKVQRHEIVPGKLEDPYALHISLGQAF
jgi:outer membrane protein assembly complex protein YaeT